MSTTVGILGYQGCIEPHEVIFKRLKVRCIRVLSPNDLASVDRLILPGGESTTMLKFVKLNSMVAPLRNFATTRPVWGICAGAILAASHVRNPNQESLNIIDITAHRNFYGAQTESFTTNIRIDFLEEPLEAQFIRAPLLAASKTKSVAPPLRINAVSHDQPVFFSQGNVWACSFHVELGSNTSLHEAFLRL